MATNNSPLPLAPRRARLLLALTAALFFAWLGWLAYLALTTTRPIVLSRPQFLAAHVDVIATVSDKDGRPDSHAKVEKVPWSRDDRLRLETGQALEVVNLPQVTRQDGWDGPGEYILPLVKERGGYAIAAIGASPGLSPGSAAPRIYRLTPETLAQLKLIRVPN